MPRAKDNAAHPQWRMWMEQAVSGLASTNPHPNPRVAALVLDDSGRLVGEGVHLAPGTPHAEIHALSAAGASAAGGTIVTTLEPCNHTGRTGPCTEAIIAAGISTVVVGALDPDGRVAGAGVDRLRAAGLDVNTGVHAQEVEAADPGYFHHRRTGRPLVTLKLAATLDGQAAAADGSSQWITGPEARTEVHALRARADAVMVGAGTLRTDDPRLDVRFDGYDGPQPRPVVIAGREPLPSEAQVYERGALVYAPQRIEPPPGAELAVSWHPEGVDLPAMMKDMASRGFLDVLVEGGPTLARALLAAGLADRLVVYLGARLGGGVGLPMVSGVWRTITDAIDVSVTRVDVVGDDVRIEATLSHERGA